MNKSMEKSEIDLQLQLIRELQLLRKGSGLLPWKLPHMATIRSCIAKRLGIDADTLSMNQMSIHLLYEIDQLGEGEVVQALRNAYAIGQEALPRSLTKRRYDLALQTKHHPDTIKAYENRAITRLAHRLLSRYTTKPIHQAVQNGKGSIPDYEIMQKALQHTVTEGLGGLYALGSHSTEILRAFGRNRHPYLDANIECYLLPSQRGPEWYTYEFRYQFHCAKEVFRIGVVSSFQDSGVLMSSGLFDEVTQLNEGANLEHEMENIIKNWQFFIYDSKTGTKQSFTFTELSIYSRFELLEPVWQVDANACRVLEVQIPKTESSYFELHIRTDLRINEHYAYWEAPGLMYLNTVTVDVSRFPDRKKWKFFLKPFLGTAFTGPVETDEDRLVLPAHSWIMNGHGIAIVWQENKL